MHSVVSEARITLDSRLFSQNVIVLTFEVANNFLEPGYKYQDAKVGTEKRHVRKLIVDIVAKPRSVYNCQSNTYAILLEFYRFWFNREGYKKAS